tara:strand:+ start:517007 stop:517342 length:336 start_codon:yes stop_codon:yes gene_type:complete
MDYQFEIDWKNTLKKLSEFGFEAIEDLDAILYIIGVQELGKGPKKFAKDDKVDLMHLAVCTVLEPFGFYKYTHTDEEGWPHYEVQSKLPHLNDMEQERLMKQAVIDYFKFY